MAKLTNRHLKRKEAEEYIHLNDGCIEAYNHSKRLHEAL